MRLRRRPESGSALMLVPAGFLVLVILGAIAIDLSAVYLGRQALLHEVGRAADDAASQLDVDALRTGQGAVIDPLAAQDTGRRHVLAAHLPGHLLGPPRVEVSADRTRVWVSATVRVPRILGRAVPGLAPSTVVTATAKADLVPVGP